MIQFNRLRLNGFKSFVDRTELEIGPGLTGIVGPNGCGKSNLVEALRWSMGESSAKRMRGGGASMEDVIFAGTEKRPSRNMAEVSVLLDNSERSAPSPYNEYDEIEVVRRIERDSGSSYRINGKNVRARDVQILYADILSGANSPYLVSQGKIASMIQAKPLERRQILEEAAGITGLYARRHEAELRLRATDNNLKRLEDLVGSMESRLQNLKKQARQASRYRNLSQEIRRLEVLISSIEWRAAHTELREIETKFAEAESRAAEHMTVVSQLTKTQNTQSQDLPELRRNDAELAAALQKQKLTLQRLEDEEERLESQLNETKSQLAQIETDRAHEKETLAENTQTIEKLDSEEKTLRARDENDDQDLSEKEGFKTELQEQTKELESSVTKLKEGVAADLARKQSLEQKLEQDRARYSAIETRLGELRETLAAKKAESRDIKRTEELRAKIARSEKALEELRGRISATQEQQQKLRDELENQRGKVQEAENKKSKINTEVSTLESVVNILSEEDVSPVLENVTTEKGFETALARALGDSLMASEDENAAMVWRQGNEDADLPPLPEGAESLAPHVKTPAVMRQALSLVGVVESAEQGDELCGKLAPGQALVTRDGDYWRWDGLHVRARAADRHTEHLRQKNRLQDLMKEKPAAEAALKAAQDKQDALKEKIAAAQDKLAGLQQEQTELNAAIRDSRRELDEALEAQTAQQTELAKLEEALSLADSDLQALAEQIKAGETNLANFDDSAIETRRAAIQEKETALYEMREKLQDAIRDFEVSRQEQSRRKARLRAIGDERINLQNRCIRANERIRELGDREETLKKRFEELKTRPESLKADRDELFGRISEMEKEKAAVSDKLAVCENELGETTKALKEAESKLAAAREERAHALATAEERKRTLDNIKSYIREHFDMAPQELLADSGVNDENMPDLGEMKQKRENAVRDRDLIGPVNLRAEQEAAELESELGGVREERNDLTEAIAELRQGIAKLNSEARERLEAAFDHVNGHFREMFTRLFNGGKAHLALIESDDPLEAGLEIYAQPPGKALQSLSLLSGGEQTLTAIALLFAMFLTNPAPICVLDEIDAPLDDANVDRVCDILEEFAERGETRFLMITHHRLTMARMDRLYGVTMAERGISQLVSVDLNQQMDFLEAAE